MIKRRNGRKSKAKRGTRRTKSTRKRGRRSMRKPKSLARRALNGSRAQNDGWVVRLPHKPPTLIPPKKRARLTFTLQFNALDLPTGDYLMYKFRGNSVYDPYYTGAGHQPRYYDQYDGLYGDYYVKSSSIEVRFTKRVAGVIQMGLYATPESTVPSKQPYMGDTPSTFRSAVATTSGYWDEVPNFTHASSSYTATDNQVVLRSKKYTKQMIDTKLVNPSTLGALTNANPSTEWYWIVVWGAPFDPEVADFGDAVVTIVYDVVFSTPETFNTS